MCREYISRLILRTWHFSTAVLVPQHNTITPLFVYHLTRLRMRRLWVLPTEAAGPEPGHLVDPGRDVRVATFNVHRLGFR